MKQNVITISKDILGGTPVFTGTRVPIQTLFDHLEAGDTLNTFLEDFPSVKKEQAIEVLELAEKILTKVDLDLIDENINR